MKLACRRACYFAKPYELGLLLGGAPGPGFEAEVCARGWALVQALGPQEFVGTEGAGDEACDVYHLGRSGLVRWPAAPGGPGPDRGPELPRGFRIALMPYQFDGQPLLVVVAISALTEPF